MDNRPASEYAQSETAAAPAAHYNHTPQPEVRPTQYTPQPEVRPANISSSNTPQPEYGLNPPAVSITCLSSGLSSAPSGSPTPGQQPDLSSSLLSLSASGSRYAVPGSPPPPHQIYARPDWPHGYSQHQHGLPGPYASPTTTVGSASPTTTAGSRPAGQVYSFVPIPGAQQHKRPRRRYEEIERMYKCGWNGCEKAYGTLNHLNAHVTMQSHGAKRTPEEFKEIRKEWKARKKEEDTQRKAAEERERAAAQAAQASQVDGPPSDPQAGQPSAYGGGRPQLPPIGYQPADSQVPGQYGGPGGGIVYQSNGQMGYPPNYPHSPYQSGPVYQQRE
ncbi:uncharacterized protein N7483_003360 [Penicillium malachiteum]|uniref:uncharacterized protein n=1 Tax=Penicillium malachiteum TaxID=1324776 RepID=UPI0025471C85|nr:uncharacterized protein N7483_003360 [Penicillium malachiteum]KAJ5728852.1 hypothetical protein N7483_003360 [Penicillium malachiteum]